MSLATASCDLWQNEQRKISSVPDLFFTQLHSLPVFAADADLHRRSMVPPSLRAIFAGIAAERSSSAKADHTFFPVL
jgi:hypothetical protein